MTHQPNKQFNTYKETGPRVPEEVLYGAWGYAGRDLVIRKKGWKIY